MTTHRCPGRARRKTNPCSARLCSELLALARRVPLSGSIALGTGESWRTTSSVTGGYRLNRYGPLPRPTSQFFGVIRPALRSAGVPGR
jgi:hypothetical protein